MTDAEMLRGLAAWLERRPGTLVIAEAYEETETATLAARLRAIAGSVEHLAGVCEGLRERIDTAERERADTIARANAALIKAGDEAGRLREELERAYAAIGRDYLARVGVER